MEGKTIMVKKARSKVNGQQNCAVRRAFEVIKDSPLSGRKSVEIQWKDRVVTVNNVAAFTQGKQDTTGSFQPPYTELSLR